MTEGKLQAIKSEIRTVLSIDNSSANACPIACRLAWQSAGTYNKDDSTGGNNGATMRFDPEIDDPANAGLDIARNSE